LTIILRCFLIAAGSETVLEAGIFWRLAKMHLLSRVGFLLKFWRQRGCQLFRVLLANSGSIIYPYIFSFCS